MIYSASYTSLTTFLLFAGALAQSPPEGIIQGDPIPQPQQEPIMNIPIPGLGGGKDSNDASDIILSDVIGKDRAINIFAGFTRDIDRISKRLNDNSQNTTVLAPLNSEIQKLPRKPWEDPGDYKELGESAYHGSDGGDRAHRNLGRFVEAHVVPRSPWKEGEKVKSLRGEELWWEHVEGRKTVQPGNIEISSIADRVSNGEVWVLKGVMNYA
ncbi:MAG: hypothetical protein Q9183_000664 [Haloplaca sp. 2 TL-2023]